MVLRKQLTMLGAGLLLLLAGLPLAYQFWPARPPPPTVIGSDAVQGLQQLQSHAGANAEDWQGERWTLVFFGFTHCADVCPATLSRIVTVLDQLGEQAAQLQPLFITLDPERDTPEHLTAYIRFFDKRIQGLTGTPEQIRQVAEAWGVYSRKVPLNGSYMLDHSSSLYLLQPDGELVRRFSGQQGSADLADEIAMLLTTY
ncbi:MAG: SCO family protein [Pseudomonas sp.]